MGEFMGSLAYGALFPPTVFTFCWLVVAIIIDMNRPCVTCAAYEQSGYSTKFSFCSELDAKMKYYLGKRKMRFYKVYINIILPWCVAFFLWLAIFGAVEGLVEGLGPSYANIIASVVLLAINCMTARFLGTPSMVFNAIVPFALSAIWLGLVGAVFGTLVAGGILLYQELRSEVLRTPLKQLRAEYKQAMERAPAVSAETPSGGSTAAGGDTL